MNIIETPKNSCKNKFTNQEIEAMADAYKTYLKSKIIEWFYNADIGYSAGFRKILEIVISEFYVPTENFDEWLKDNIQIVLQKIKMKQMSEI